jgi:hypothetical protein
MFLSLKHKVHALLALFLTAVLFGSMLGKPVHILLSHHYEETAALNNFSTSGEISNPHSDCPICNFEFCSFIPQSQVHVPKADVAFAQEITPRTADRIIIQTSHHFQLRGPPVL